jgi:Rab3 GTPase-activating protein regulatory subunit N-terminus
MVDSYDCRSLLQYAARAEADLSSVSSSVDDINPPQLLAHSIQEHNQHFLLLVARTKHSMAAQLYWMESGEPWNELKDEGREMDTSTSRVSEDPVEIVLLRADLDSHEEEEAITCVTVVERSSRAKSSNSARSITSTSSLIKGVMSFEENTPAPDTITFSPSSSTESTPSLAIVFGTTLGNVYTVPVTILNHQSSAHDYSLQRVPSPSGISLLLVLSHPSLHEEEFTSRDVQSLSMTAVHTETTPELLLTIVYNNATFLRIPTSACFPPGFDQRSFLDSIRHRARLLLIRPDHAARVLPLPPNQSSRQVRSPLQDLLSLTSNRNKSMGTPNEAFVYYPDGGHAISELVPTWAFYASFSSVETDHHTSALPPSPMTDTTEFDEPEEELDDDGILFVSVTKALVGSAVGAWRWGVRHKPPSDDNASSVSLEPTWIDYTVSSVWHDVPRAIEQATVDPVQGRLIATTDSLGRIVLIERSTRQVIRMWKGFRDASCYWIQQEASSGSSGLYLVIHSRQRRRIEVWPVRHGGRAISLAVGRGTQVVPLFSVSGTSQCLWTVSPHRLEWIQVPARDETPVEAPTRPNRTLSKAASFTKQQSGALRLKHLQQLLSASSHLTLQDVRAALYEILSLVDLSTALDLCATGSVLDDTLGVQGSSFHREVIAHCRSVLNTALRGDGNALDRSLPSRTNPMVSGLTQKLEYHEKVRGMRRKFYFLGFGLILLYFCVCSW